MYIFQVPTSFSFEILSCICQQQIILISHDNKNCFDIFFSLQKLEALDFITMLSQWSSFSSQKVQIRFFAPSLLDFPPIFIPAFFYLARKWVTHPIPFVVALGDKCCFDAAFFCVFPRLRRSRYKKMLAKRNVKNILKLLLRHIVNSINKEEVE